MKLMRTIFLFVLVMSMVTLAAADNGADQSDERTTVATVAAKDTALLEIDADLEAKLQTTSSDDSCLKILKERFPQARENRLVATCNKYQRLAKNHPAVATALKSKVMGRLQTKVDEETVAKLQQRTAVEIRKIAALNSQELGQIKRLSDDEIERIGKLSRAQLERLQNQYGEDLDTVAKHTMIKKYTAQEYYQKRVIAEKKLKDAEEKYQQALNRYQEEKNGLLEERSAWRQAVDEGEEETAIEYAKAYLTHAANLVIEALHKVEAKIEADDDYSEEEAKNALDNIADNIALMEQAKEEVANASTKEEIKAAGETILQAWERVRVRLEIHAHNVITNRVRQLFRKSEQLESRLETLIAKLDDEGNDVSDVDELMGNYSELIDEARELLKNADDLYHEGGEAQLKEAKALVAQAHEKLKNAHAVLRTIVATLKETGEEFELETEGDIVVVFETDSEGVVEVQEVEGSDKTSSEGVVEVQEVEGSDKTSDDETHAEEHPETDENDQKEGTGIIDDAEGNETSKNETEMNGDIDVDVDVNVTGNVSMEV